MRAAAFPSERREDRVVEESMAFPERERVGSIRMERMVYSSRITGSRRGPPMKGDDITCMYGCVIVVAIIVCVEWISL